LGRVIPVQSGFTVYEPVGSPGYVALMALDPVDFKAPCLASKVGAKDNV